MCTTETDEPRVLKAVESEGNNYIVKPRTAESLGEEIMRTVARPRAAAS